MSIKPSKRIVKGAAGLAIATAMVLPGVASAADSPQCLLTSDGQLAVCGVPDKSSQSSGLAGSLGQIPLIGPLLASLFAS
ncbi:hypothetical protein [Smaragdicoccus niigatensis]|uniref:hypothetical protein n=1 Tax=Smaragdicoccus niigatensis TaxID=359359 RepID=UPI00035D0EA6|nr:hypothetical protein [Smaragdicoccus niigatensis]